jgi:hypothetical protein
MVSDAASQWTPTSQPPRWLRDDPPGEAERNQDAAGFVEAVKRTVVRSRYRLIATLEKPMKRLLICAATTVAAIVMIAVPIAAHAHSGSVSGPAAGAAARVGGCAVPKFVPEVTDYLTFQQQVVANGCTVIFNGRPNATPVRTIHGVGAYAGPANSDGTYPPDSYLGTVKPGQVLPPGSLIIASVNGVKFFQPHW